MTEPTLTGELLIERMTASERARAERVVSVLPALREASAHADREGTFVRSHIRTLSDAGLLGLVVPESHGGLGGGLRDLAAATFALGTACPSTALAYFFHCSSASRGLLALEAIDAGLFDATEVPIVRAFADKVLRKMGREGKWLANFASESTKNEKAAITIETEATKVEGGWLLNGVKSFGCATGVADEYLVTAKLQGTETAEGLATFFVRRDASGVSERTKWDAIGMRATATHGLVLKDVFVPADEALAIPGAFTRMMRMSRGSFVGNQAAGVAVYLGATQAAFDYAVEQLLKRKYEDTGRPMAENPLYQMMIGDMLTDLETAYLWLRRQIELESAEPPLRSKEAVVRQWRLCKGEVAEACFRVTQTAMKACGTGATVNGGPLARALRDTSMGLVQAFPAERGRLMAAQSLVTDAEQAMFGAGR